MEYGITPNGFIKKTYPVILEEILENYETAFPGFKKHPSNALYIQAQAAANREEIFWNMLEAVYYSRYVITASGNALTMRVIDIIGKRLEPRPAVGYCKVIADRGTIIPQGALIKRKDSDIQYRVLYQYIIESSDPMQISVQCTTNGIIGNAPESTIESFVETISGVTSVFNDAAILGGAEEENDDELKERYYASLQDLRGSNIPAINAKLRSLGLPAYRVRENRTKNEALIDGVLLPPHSIAATVIGGSDDDIADALFHTKAGGIDMLGSTSVTIVEDGTNYKILFERGTGSTVYVKLAIKVNYQFLATYEQKLKEQIADYINHLAIDETLDYELLIARAFDGVPGVTSLNLFVGREASPTGQTDLKPKPNEKFVVSDDSVQITINR